MTGHLARAALTSGTWTVSDSRTRVAFVARSLGRPVHGSVACCWGEVEIAQDGRPVRVAAELDLDSLDTGVARRDADLRKPNLLDIDRYPAMTWTADRFTPGDPGRWTAGGVLAVRGTRAPLTLDGEVEVRPDGWLRVRATAALDRTTLGIRAPRLLIGRVVGVDVDAWLHRRRPG